MPDQNISIAISTAFDPNGTNQAITAVHDFSAATDESSRAITHAADTTDTHSKKTEKASGQTKNWGMAANAMSYQMQDFSVQVGGGTSAVTAFAQQAPQLIDGLRMAGLLTGGMGMAMMGISALLPIVMFGGKALWESFNSGGEAAKKVLEEHNAMLAKVAKNLGNMVSEENARIDELTKNAIEKDEILSRHYLETRKAKDAADTASLAIAEKLNTAQGILNASLGITVNKYQDISDAAEAQQKKLDLAAAQKIAAENAKLQAAAHESRGPEETLGKGYENQRRLAAELEAEKKKLEILRAQRMEVEKASEASAWFDPLKSQAKREAVAEFPEVDKHVKDRELRVAQMVLDLKKQTDANTRNETLAAGAISKLEDVTGAVTEEIQTIHKNLEADTTTVQVKALAEKEKAMATDLQTVLDAATPLTATYAGNKDRLSQMLADGQIAANETQGMSSNLSTLLGGIQSGNVAVNGNIAELIKLMTALQAQQAGHQGTITELANKVANLQNQRSMTPR